MTTQASSKPERCTHSAEISKTARGSLPFDAYFSAGRRKSLDVIVESKEHTPCGRYDVEDDVALRHRRIDDRDLGLPWHAPSLEEGNAFSRRRLVLAVPPSPPVLCTVLSFF